MQHAGKQFLYRSLTFREQCPPSMAVHGFTSLFLCGIIPLAGWTDLAHVWTVHLGREVDWCSQHLY